MSKEREALNMERALKLALDLALDVIANADTRLVVKAIALASVIDSALAEQPAQPTKPWQGLTEFERIELRMSYGNNPEAHARATEAKLREKNEHWEKNT